MAEDQVEAIQQSDSAVTAAPAAAVAPAASMAPAGTENSTVPPASATGGDTGAAKNEDQDTQMADADAQSNQAPGTPTASTAAAAASQATPQKGAAATPNGVSPAAANSIASATTTPMPAKAAPHGAPARQYLNARLTPTLLEGMKKIALEQPDNPLKVLGEFLLQKSSELEGAQT